MHAVDSLLMELGRESETTRRLLDRLPEDKLAWKPHEKSMTLGQLAMHVATIPGAIASALSVDCYDVSADTTPAPAGSRAGFLDAFDKSLADARAVLSRPPAMVTKGPPSSGAVLVKATSGISLGLPDSGKSLRKASRSLST